MKKNAFTLIELIVTITILAILATIAILSVQYFLKDARNSQRISDMTNISKALNVFKIQSWYYPLPSDYTEVTYSWTEVWKQGVFSEDTRRILGNQSYLSKVPLDPLTYNKYTYSVLNNKQEFQLAWVFEGNYNTYASNININKKTYAWWDDFTTIIKWNYNWKIAKVSTWWYIYILAVPTIISWDTNEKDLIKLINKKRLVYNKSKILPKNFKNNFELIKLEKLPEKTIVNTWSLIVFKTDKLFTLSDSNNQQIFINNLKNAYSGSYLLSSEIEKIISNPNIFTAQNIIKKELIPSLKITASTSSTNNNSNSSNNTNNLVCSDMTQENVDNLNNAFSWALWTSYTKDQWCNLTMLDAYWSNLNSVPDEIWYLTNLNYLYLDYNNLNSIPNTIWNLVNLLEFSFSDNNISTIPAEIWNLGNLTRLNIENTNITTLPAEIWNLNNLNRLDIRSNNNLTTLPTQIWNLNNLKTLNIENNANLTTLPTQIWNLNNLEVLTLRNLAITAIPNEIGNLNKLGYFNVYNNTNLTTIPLTIENLNNLKYLAIGGNSNINNLEISNPNLNNLSITNNNSLNTIILNNLPNLQYLTITDNNNFTTLELNNLPNLQNLTLIRNSALTSLPSEIWNLNNLKIAYLSTNNLTTLPNELANLTNLQTLWLTENPNLWNLSYQFSYYNTTPRTEDNITPDWKTMTIVWNWTTIDITVSP